MQSPEPEAHDKVLGNNPDQIGIWLVHVCHLLDFSINTNYSKLCSIVCRYGFPPRELHPPDEGHEGDPVPLQHGDRVMVEHLKPVVPEEHPPDVVMSEMKARGGEGSASSGSEAEAKSNQQRQGVCAMIVLLQNINVYAVANGGWRLGD